MSKMYIDVGSTYFKAFTQDNITHYFRNFETTIYDDLTSKCHDLIEQHDKKDIHICSSANGGLSTLIIGISQSFSLKYASNIAYNSGINIIDTVLYSKIEKSEIPSDLIDVVIIVGGIDSVQDVFDEKLLNYLQKMHYSNIVYVGSQTQIPYLKKNIENLVVLDNIITNKLQMNEDRLKEYLTNLYNQDIVGKEEIKKLYEITDNQIYSTPYIVNRALPLIHTKVDVVDPYIVIDIGGATTDIHYSKDLVEDNIITENEYDRLVFKKLGVYKSRDSLVFTAKNNEFVYELLAHLNTTENMLEHKSDETTKLLMQLSIFLVLYKVSHQHQKYLNLKLTGLNSIVLTGGITKVLSREQMEDIVTFFYKKILNFHVFPKVVVDDDYTIWTLGMNAK
ncbi:MAG: glutamate mutase L [Campylobacterota bacterium]|nr:glutamate mutase L [Campylobacterota bacterium]